MHDLPPRGGDDEDRELLLDMSERATLLYWNSDRSVNSIAEDLGLSKGRLYELIQPLKSGDQCDICRSDLVFDNRTSRDRSEALCPSCDGGPIPAPLRLRGHRGAAGADSQGGASFPSGANPEAPPLGLGGVVAGLLIGTVAGVLLGRAFRR